MKNLLFLITFVLSVYSANGQSNSFDTRLLSKFSIAELNEMQSKSPDTYAYWNFYVANAFQVADLPSGKSNAHEIKSSVKVLDMDKVNIFDLHFVPSPKDFQYYRIEGTDKLLVIISEEQIKEKFLKSTK